MTNKKIGPTLLIGFLLLILFFILGVKLGQKVEKTNKTINYLLSLTPSPKLTPTKVEERTKFDLFENKKCGIKFLYPSNLNVKSASTSAFFQNSKGERSISFDCSSIKNNLKDDKIATGEAGFKNKKIIVQQKTTGNTLFYIFNIKNPLNQKNITVNIAEDLYPLFESTIQFTPE